MASWQTKSSRVAYKNPWLIVHEDEVVRPDGSDGLYGYIESTCDSVYVVPVDDNGDTYIVQQERYTAKRSTWECVAGRIDNDNPLDAAKRELLEETGLTATSWTPIGSLDAAVGLSKLKFTVYLAEGLTQTTTKLDQVDGILAAKKLPFDELIQMIMSGELTCSESTAAFFMTRSYLDTRSVHE